MTNKIHLTINTSICIAGREDKKRVHWGRFNGSFYHAWLTPREIAVNLWRGFAICQPLFPVVRNSDNVTNMTWVGLDFDTEDSRSDIDNILTSDWLILKHATILHTSASHTPDKPRSRVIFILEEPMDKSIVVPALVTIQSMLASKFGADIVDTNCTDASRFFYGAKGCDMRLFEDKRLPASIIQELAHAPMDTDSLAIQTDSNDTLSFASAFSNSNKDNNTEANDRYTRHAWRLIEVLIDELGNAPKGQRHEALKNTSLRLASLTRATWHKARIHEPQLREQLRQACARNGLLSDKHGEREVESTIKWAFEKCNGVADKPSQPDKCLGIPKGAICAGDNVSAKVGDRTIAGIVQSVRNSYGHWESNVAGVWLPNSLCEVLS